MLKVLDEILTTNKIETREGGFIDLHSHTRREQGIFLQEMFDLAKPTSSLEVGFAYGISTLFILEKHQFYKSAPKAHIVIEPYPWGDTALFNINKAELGEYLDIRNDLSDKVIPSLYLSGHRIQFAYIDTTKLFDVVMQDFYFTDKILDVNGIMVIDDCDTNGINKVVRFISSLPHYKILGKHGPIKKGWKFNLVANIYSLLIRLIPFKKKIIPNISLKTSKELDLDYRCIAFQKIENDSRKWDWDKPL